MKPRCFLSLIISLLIIILINQYVFAFSEPVRQFIQDGKLIRLLIKNEIKGFPLTPLQDVDIIDLQSKKYFRLLKDSKYLVRVADGVDEKITLYNLKGDRLFAGRDLEIEGKVILGREVYPGKVEFILTKKGINIYNTVGLSELLSGILAGKLPEVLAGKISGVSRDYLPAIKAQAVVGRTYILYRLFNNKSGRLSFPAYQGIVDVNNLIRDAVNSTAGQILKERGEVARIDFPLPVQNSLVMAATGSDYRDILHHYYQGLELVDLTRVVEEELKVDAEIQWGLRYQEIRQLTWWGPRVITILKLRFDRLRYKVEPVLANGKIPGLEDLSDLVRSRGALAGVNGGYFSYTGRPLGLLMIDGQMVSEPVKERTALGITSDNRFLINRVEWRGLFSGYKGDVKIEVTGVNRKPAGDEIVIYNRYYGTFAPAVQDDIIELVISKDKIKQINEGGTDRRTIIPEDGFILQARGKGRAKLTGFAVGDRVSYEDDFNPDWEDAGVISALGAGPMLIKDGQVRITTAEEEFQPDIARGRAPRSALGINSEGHLLIFTVDGRQPDLSIGISLEELAQFMLDYGVVKGMNLDGGGSARMVVRGYTMNNPSDKRLISNGLIIVKPD